MQNKKIFENEQNTYLKKWSIKRTQKSVIFIKWEI